MITILTGMRWYLNVVLIYISLVTRDDEHFFMFVGLMYVFFCEQSVHILCPLLNGLVCFFPVNLFEFFVNSGYHPFVSWVDCKNIPHSVGCQFTLMTVSFAVQKLWSLIRSHLSILAFVANAFGVLFMKSLPMPMS